MYCWSIRAAPIVELGPLKQKGGKLVHCWAFEGAPAPLMVGQSMFELEWPPRSGRKQSFPEVDEARLFDTEEALKKILPGQADFIRELRAQLDRKLRAE